MLNIGEKITRLRKQHNLSQQELAKKIGASRTIIGNYERNTNTPSIEVLIRLANIFNVSVDFLIGEGELSSYDKDLLKRIEDIEKLDPETKKHLFFMIDNVIQNYKTRKAFAVQK
jgi:transcriptional regulator with XRE-family HTH domain